MSFSNVSNNTHNCSHTQQTTNHSKTTQTCTEATPLTDLIEQLVTPSKNNDLATQTLVFILKNTYGMRFISKETLPDFIKELQHELTIYGSLKSYNPRRSSEPICGTLQKPSRSRSPSVASTMSTPAKIDPIVTHGIGLKQIIPDIESIDSIPVFIDKILNLNPHEALKLLNVYLRLQPQKSFTSLFILGVVANKHPQLSKAPPEFDIQSSSALLTTAIQLSYSAYTPETISICSKLGYDLSKLRGYELLEMAWKNKSLTFIVHLIENNLKIPCEDTIKAEREKTISKSSKSITLGLFASFLATNKILVLESIFDSFSSEIHKFNKKLFISLLELITTQINIEIKKPNQNTHKITLLKTMQNTMLGPHSRFI